MNLRPYIKRLIYDLLSNSPLLKIKNIQINRPLPILLSECPLVLIYTNDEQNELYSGSEYTPQTYLRKLGVTIEIVTYQQPSADDFLDEVAGQIEWILFATEFLGDTKECVNGLKLISTKTLSFESGSEKIYDACQMQFEVPYFADMILDKKYSDFSEYYAEFNRVGYKSTTIDPTLIAAEGKL